MKLFKYNQFIKESEEVKKNDLIEYWIERKDLEDLFEPFIDDEYIITYNKIVFKEEPLNLEEDIVNIGDEIYPGWFIKITFNRKLKGREDLTNDFKSIVRELELDGYEITIEDSEGKINIDYVFFRKGTPIIWIPETTGKKIPSSDELKNHGDYLSDGDIYEALDRIYLYAKQTDLVKISNQLQLAGIYEWSNIKVNDKGRMFVELQIEDMANLFLERNSRYIELLSNGLDRTDYWSDYLPDISSLFTYHLTKEHKKSIAEYVFKELDQDEILELIEDKSNQDLSGKTEEEIIDFLVNGKTNSLEYICDENDFELIEELRRILSDHESDARCEANEKEMYKEFDRKLEREEIDFIKENRLGTKYYYSKNANGNSIRTEYEEYTWFYKVFFQERWITDNKKTLKGYDLEDVFREWCSDSYFEFRLDPYYSDYGSVEDEYLHSDFDEKIKEFL
jgi:hypothetical protein